MGKGGAASGGGGGGGGCMGTLIFIVQILLAWFVPPLGLWWARGIDQAWWIITIIYVIWWFSAWDFAGQTKWVMIGISVISVYLVIFGGGAKSQ